MTNFSDAFYKPDPDPRPDFRKNWTLICWTPMFNVFKAYFLFCPVKKNLIGFPSMQDLTATARH